MKACKHGHGVYTTRDCPECNRIRRRAYYVENSEEVKQKEKERRVITKAEMREYRKMYNVLHPEAKRRSDLRYKYKLTLEQYNEMVTLQDNKCAICGEPETAYRKGKLMILAVDHNHKTKVVRQLLCQKHNNMIGLAKEDINILQNAITYLKKHSI